MQLVVTDAKGNMMVVEVDDPSAPDLKSNSPTHLPPHKAATVRGEKSRDSQVIIVEELPALPPATPSEEDMTKILTADENNKSRVPHEEVVLISTETDTEPTTESECEGEDTPKHDPLPSTAAISPLKLDKQEILVKPSIMDGQGKEKEQVAVDDLETSPHDASTHAEPENPTLRVSPATPGAAEEPHGDTPEVNPALLGKSSTYQARKSSAQSSEKGNSPKADSKDKQRKASNPTDLSATSSPKKKARQSPGKLVIDPPTTNVAPPPMNRQRTSKCPPTPQTNSLLAYNQYGQIVRVKDMNEPQDPSKFTVTETLRLINKVYGYQLRRRMNEVVAIQMQERTYPGKPEGGEAQESDDIESPKRPLIRSLSSWEYSPFPLSPLPTTPEGLQMTLVYDGPPRVLELGCGDGSWCFASKERHPDWIIEGVDDADHWTKAWPHLTFKSFIYTACRGPKDCKEAESEQSKEKDYFKGFKRKQDHPEFVVRNLNALLAHTDPFPHNLYGLIRGRDIFDRVESYKEFLEDVRLILQPDGVIEFVELDPRPRADFMDGDSVKYATPSPSSHVSGPETNWTDQIVDRFKETDHELATTVEGWINRVAERHKAIFRPKDGVPAPQLKSWIEGAGFWDVKEMVFRLRMGGETGGGKMMLEAMKEHVKIEDSIPQLRKKLPQLEMEYITKGDFFLNLHIVTGRKPKWPRPGDLLLDGTRQEMTTSKYSQMAKLNDAKSNQWKRFDLDGKLTHMMETLGAMPTGENGVPESKVSTPLPMTPNPVPSKGP